MESKGNKKKKKLNTTRWVDRNVAQHTAEDPTKVENLSMGDGLYLRTSPKKKVGKNITKSWIHHYKENGKRKVFHIGTFPEMTLLEARNENSALNEKSKQGITPTGESLDAMLDALTLDELFNGKEAVDGKKGFDGFLKLATTDDGDPLRPKTLQNYKQIFKKDILDKIGKRRVSAITLREINAVLNPIAVRGARNQQFQAFKCLRKVFSFAVEQGLITVSPMKDMKRIGKKHDERERTLSPTELNVLLNELPNATMPEDCKNALLLILYTGARPGEVVNMTAENINGDWLTLSRDERKNKKAHRSYLVPEAKALIPASGSFNISTNNYLSKKLARALTGKEAGKKDITKSLPIAHFTPNDLRRTCATGLSELSFIDDLLDVYQGRQKTGVVRVYNRNRYDKERQEMAEAWAQRLENIRTETEIIPLAQEGVEAAT